MTSKFIDSMLPKYQSESASSVVNYSPAAAAQHHARMYPYVSMGTPHQQAAAAAAFGAAAAASSTMVPFSSSLAAAAASADSDKSCRYSNPATGLSADSMVNYTLSHAAAAQNGASTTSTMAAAAQFYHQAAAASDPNNPLNTSCSQGTGQPIPDIPRYPWMSITGKYIQQSILLFVSFFNVHNHFSYAFIIAPFIPVTLEVKEISFSCLNCH